MGDVRAPARRPGWWPGWPKRAFDCVVAAVGLIVLAPLLGVTALAIRLAIGRPVIFAQRRPGRHWRPFILYKFRTMSSAHAADGRLLPDRERLTRLGRLLLMEYLPRYTREQARRHEVRPGIIGWAQLKGRNTLPWATSLADLLGVGAVHLYALRHLKARMEGYPTPWRTGNDANHPSDASAVPGS